ncbi:MAG: alpha-N-acetylglucosaminidase TIM-barrel domain-containing protein [Thermoguttaceae bacterium]
MLTRIQKFVLCFLLCFSFTNLFLCQAICAEEKESQHNGESEKTITAARGVQERMVPELNDKVVFETIPASENGSDVFEIATKNGKLVVRGNNAVSISSGLNWYLKHYCDSQITLRSRQVKIPENLPEISEPLRIVSPYKYRYYFNYCCFSYTLAWWDWNDWEKMIDLLALYGVNAPLSVTGQEAVWQNVGKRLGLSDEQMQDFYVGPGYLPFGWMGCIDRWGGPLPEKWIDEHAALQQKILKRQRELGMTPILQGFTGHVPRKLGEVEKDANIIALNPWIDFEPTYFVDPHDPFFVEVGKIFIEEQTKLFGTNHLYASDSFIEMRPTSDEPEFLRKMGASIYESMRAADPDAIWVLQSWPFCVNQPQFWQPPQKEAFFTSVPEGRLLVVDLYCELIPGWSQFDVAFYGQPWIWAIIQNFGGQVSLHGGLDVMANDLRKAIELKNTCNNKDNKAGNLEGIGYIMEGLGWNPIIDEFQSDMIWCEQVPDTTQWRKEFVQRRYGKFTDKTQTVWNHLHKTTYNRSGQVGTILMREPALRGTVREIDKTYLPIWKELLDCADEVGDTRTYLFDVTNVTRHTLGELAPLFYNDVVVAYYNKDRTALKTAAEKLNTLILDIDRLLASDSEFLLGTWLESAKRWGKTDEERKHYEWNARTIITLWGPTYSLDDYSARQWSGMFSDYYARRWKLFCDELDLCLAENKSWNEEEFRQKLFQLQIDWAKENTAFPTKASGDDTVKLANELYEKYAKEFEMEIPKYYMTNRGLVSSDEFDTVESLTTGKPVSCSDFMTPFPPTKANDGIVADQDSFWGCDITGKDVDAWWEVDLEQPTEVNRVVVVCYYDDSRYYSFYVEGSLDNENWTMLSDMKDNTAPSTIEGYECKFAPAKIRYLRVTETYNSANTGRHLVEVMAFGP